MTVIFHEKPGHSFHILIPNEITMVTDLAQNFITPTRIFKIKIFVIIML